MSEFGIEQELSLLGLSLLSGYENRTIPILYLCTCGGIGKSLIANIRKGTYCGHCIENSYKEEFLQYGCEILMYENSLKITYRCSCGSITTRQASHWRNNKSCKQCRTAWNFKSDKLPVRPSLHAWKRQVLGRDGYVCANCNNSEELRVHHIEAYTARPDLAAETFNGLTLCNTCHTELHRLFGYNVGYVNLESVLADKTILQTRGIYASNYLLAERSGI